MFVAEPIRTGPIGIFRGETWASFGQSIVVRKTGSFCNFVNYGGCSVDAAIVAVFSELVSIKRRAKIPPLQQRYAAPCRTVTCIRRGPQFWNPWAVGISLYCRWRNLIGQLWMWTEGSSNQHFFLPNIFSVLFPRWIHELCLMEL